MLNLADAPEIPAGILAALTVARKPAERVKLERQAATAELMRVAAVLPNPDALDWEEWNKVGLASFAASGGEDDGLDAFLAWSSKNPKHDEQTTRDRWANYHRSPPSNIGWGYLQTQARATRRRRTRGHPSRR